MDVIHNPFYGLSISTFFQLKTPKRTLRKPGPQYIIFELYEIRPKY